MNCLSFAQGNIDTNDVLDAACTKWNFMNISQEQLAVTVLVLIHIICSQGRVLGIHSKVILSGRQANTLPGWIAKSNGLVSSIGIGKF